MKTDSPLRMMDANLNRVAEGLRVVEDILRFNLEDKEASQRVRLLRHEVRALLADKYPQLLAERNVRTDPGVVTSREQVLDGKVNWQDLFLANLKRVQEGLRVLEEAAHLLGERDLAKNLEQRRFAAYSLEQELAPCLLPSARNKKAKVLPAGIYALTSEPHSLGRGNLEVAGEILKAGVKILQYREKSKKQGEMLQECLALRQMTREAGALFIVNDHIDIAMAVEADGVHIGQEDMPVPVVRRLIGPDKIIGLSTHSPEQARLAVTAGVDYIGVGPIYATQTKSDVCDPVGLEYLQYVVERLAIPFVAIGGIKEHNLGQVVKAGAATVALVTEIVGSEDIAGEISRLSSIMAQA